MNETERTVSDKVRDKLHKLIHYTWKKNVKGIRLLGWHFYMSRRPMRLKTARAYDSTLRSEDRRAMFEALWERSGGRCEICGRQMDRDSRTRREHNEVMATCHHVIPLSMGVRGTAHDTVNDVMAEVIRRNPMMLEYCNAKSLEYLEEHYGIRKEA